MLLFYLEKMIKMNLTKFNFWLSYVNIFEEVAQVFSIDVDRDDNSKALPSHSIFVSLVCSVIRLGNGGSVENANCR